MPNYSFVCDCCNHEFDEILPMKDSDLPLKNLVQIVKRRRLPKTGVSIRLG
jgi:predicted nucleic acid-binding Zn ribbon protein